MEFYQSEKVGTLFERPHSFLINVPYRRLLN